MRQGPNGRRPRGRPNRKQHGGPSRPNNYDSSGPEGRIRGNARQVYEKYVGLARDAASAGEGLSAETYLQYAEHYYRIINSSTDPETGDRRPARNESNGRDEQGRQANPQETSDPNQPSQDAREPEKDRDGLDRVLSKDGDERRPNTRPRSRQRSNRAQEEQPKQTGNGEAKDAAASAPQPSDDSGTDGESAKDTDKETAGA